MAKKKFNHPNATHSKRTLTGKKVLISVKDLPFMFCLSQQALYLAVLKVNFQMPSLYSQRIFNHLKRSYLERSLLHSKCKQEPRYKCLIRGYLMEAQKEGIIEDKNILPKKFNNSYLKKEFLSNPDIERTFDHLTEKWLQQRYQKDLKICLKLKETILKILDLEKLAWAKGTKSETNISSNIIRHNEYKDCSNQGTVGEVKLEPGAQFMHDSEPDHEIMEKANHVFCNVFKRIRLPWTRDYQIRMRQTRDKLVKAFNRPDMPSDEEVEQ